LNLREKEPPGTTSISKGGRSWAGQVSSKTKDDYSLIILGFDEAHTLTFTDLGFDTLAKKVFLGDDWDLERVTADSHIVYLGRPL
jgi:photosystem II stability/assembly factor-like uncharacterized protein